MMGLLRHVRVISATQERHSRIPAATKTVICLDAAECPRQTVQAYDVQPQVSAWRDMKAQPWGDADQVLVTGVGPMYVNVLEAHDAYYVIGEYDSADCDHVEACLLAFAAVSQVDIERLQTVMMTASVCNETSPFPNPSYSALSWRHALGLACLQERSSELAPS